MNRHGRATRFGAFGALILVLVAACGGSAGATPTPSPAPSATPAAVVASPSVAASPSEAAPTATATAAAGASVAPGGPATLDGPAQVEGGKQFEVAWTGPKGPSDYVTIVAVGKDKWTNEPYFNASGGSPGKLVAPTTAGAYELWYVSNADDKVLARRPISVTPFVGTVSGPPTAEAGSRFSAAWTGPAGPGDYVTITPLGAEKWTDESYFYTTAGSPGELVAPLKDGSYELWYVTGTDSRTMARAPITVTPYTVTLDAPSSVAAGATIKVAWTGPNGPSDYITIAPAGSPDGTYLSYAYTSSGSPASITAPTEAGKYEIRYASDRVKGITFKSIPIVVK